MTRRRRAVAAVLGGFAAGAVLLAGPAAAHPTDEVIQQAYLTPTTSGLTVELDLTPRVLVAPAFAADVDTGRNRAISAQEEAWFVAGVASALTLRVDGATVPLTVTGHTVAPYQLLAAAGGAVTITLTAPLPAGARSIEFHDAFDPGRSTVQQDVLVAPTDPAGIDTISRAAGGRTITVTLAEPAVARAPAAARTPAAGGGSGLLRALREPLSSPWALVALLATCALLGALHALTPGHGKALLAAHLVGTRGTPRQAIGLGAVITVSHTAAVIALGVAVLAAGRFIAPGVVVPVLEVAAGAVVVVLGARLLLRRRGHPHDHPHHHEPGGALMGVTGGIIPCPEALSVLLLAIGLNRTALGLGMIAAFSAGLAAVLVGSGLLLVSARTTLERFRGRATGRLARWVPAVSAAVVTALGVTMAVTGMAHLTR
ncbi:hypothetical protein AB0K00_05995 [Dactylosporangium sp. NPDC049525]|uniref:hypothetical protein n=1 Tax=Dactylosporangium sp. NPDC049525 TaxID=3154730 RepID=UPI00342C5206